MDTPSRTPDGDPLHCGVCGQQSRVATNHLAADQICPFCGSTSWVIPQDDGTLQESETVMRSSSPSKRIFKKHDLVKIVKGNFKGVSGEIDREEIDGSFTVMATIFGKKTPLTMDEAELEFLSKPS